MIFMKWKIQGSVDSGQPVPDSPQSDTSDSPIDEGAFGCAPSASRAREVALQVAEGVR